MESTIASFVDSSGNQFYRIHCLLTPAEINLWDPQLCWLQEKLDQPFCWLLKIYTCHSLISHQFYGQLNKKHSLYYIINLILNFTMYISLFNVENDHNYNLKQSLLTTSISSHFKPPCDGVVRNGIWRKARNSQGIATLISMQPHMENLKSSSQTIVDRIAHC